MTPQYRNEATARALEIYPDAGERQEARGERNLYPILKRTVDILGSTFGLLALIPLFTVVAIAIKWEDPKGPVFFSQTRIGKNGKPFRIYKFRSMCVDAEEKLKNMRELNSISGPMFKIKQDPRITKVGHFIRKTSIDELPQFLNVLIGNMSLVGPRPSSAWEVDQYTNHDRKRLTVTPGCTGLWQISGRNELGFREMLELDLAYIERKCIWNDFKIMLKTVKIMFSSKGAY